MDRYARGAYVLRALAAAEPLLLDGSADPLRLVLLTCAEGCDRLAELEPEHAAALRRVEELEGLLARAHDALGAMPLPTEGGQWEVFTLSQEIRRALDHNDRAERSR
jgi:hypothetical protein